MKELIKITENNGKKAVSARELHKYIETWHYNESYPNYIVSSFGNIKECASDKPVKIHRNNRGYKSVSINTLNGCKLKLLHRIVAETFLTVKLNEKLTVNHINGNKSDNRTINLEWVTYSENNKHAYRIGLKKGFSSLKNKRGYDYHLSREVSQYDLNGNFIKTFGSLRLASEDTKTSRGCISLCAKGKYKQANGYLWRFGSVNTYPVDVLSEVIKAN